MEDMVEASCFLSLLWCRRKNGGRESGEDDDLRRRPESVLALDLQKNKIKSLVKITKTTFVT